MKGPVAYGAAAFCLLLPLSSLLVFAAAAESEQSVWTQAGAGTANEGRGTQGVPAADPQAGGMVREDEVTDERHGTERRPRAFWRSSSGLFSKASGTVSKLLTVSAIAAAVVMLGRVLSSCLAEIGVAKRRDASVSGAPESEMCRELVGGVSESDDPKLATSVARSVKSLRLPGSMSNQVLTAAVLFAVLAIGFASPYLRNREEEVSELKATGGGTLGSDEEEIQDTYPVVEIGEHTVKVGETWKTVDGEDQPGLRTSFGFSAGGKRYDIYPTAETRRILVKERLFRRVLRVLSKPPVSKTGETGTTLVWGRESERSVLVYFGEVTQDDDSLVATWQVFLPRGAFGFQPGESGGDEEAQGCSDLYNAVNAVAHVLMTGKAPPE